MPSYDLDRYLADDALLLRGVVSERHPKGKTYRIESPNAKVGLQLKRVMQSWATRGPESPPTEQDLADLIDLITDESGEQVDFQVLLMGSTYQQMIDDGVSADRLDMITKLVVTHYGSGSHVAQAMVDAAGEAKAPNQAAQRATQPTKGGSKSRQASTATRGRTRNQASTRSSTSASEPEATAV